MRDWGGGGESAGYGGRVKQDQRGKDNILAKLHALEQCQPLISPSCGCHEGKKEGKRKSACQSVYPFVSTSTGFDEQ